MQKKKGISLIVLVISIIIMIILASAVIITINNTNIMDRAENAVNASNKQEIQTLVQLMWSEEYLETNGNIDAAALESNIKQEIEKMGVNPDDYIIKVTKSGVQFLDKPDWEFAYAYNRSKDEWSSKIPATAGSVEGDITAKFYKTGSENAYKMLIEGSGDIKDLISSDKTIGYAWQSDSTLLSSGSNAETYVMPYVTEIIIDDSITNIGGYAFAGASKLKSVYIGNDVKEIKAYAFKDSNAVTAIQVGTLETWNNTIIRKNNSGLLKANVTYTYRTEVERLANEGLQKALSAGEKTESKLQAAVTTYLQENDITEAEQALYNIKATTAGIEITAKETTLGNIILNGADYGKTVNYSANGVNDWKILHKRTLNDEEYIYLISSDNIPQTSYPSNLPGEHIENKIHWARIANIATPTVEQPSLWMAGEKAINSSVLSTYLSEELYWNVFKNSKYGDNVVGASGTPTTEMLVASYNARSAALGDTEELTLTVKSSGYQKVSPSTSKLDILYGPTYFWVASPGDDGAYWAVFGMYGWSTEFSDYEMNPGFGIRPVICLKSSTPAYVGLSADSTDIILK